MKTHLDYLLTAYLFDSISAEGRREVESHLAECAACRAQLAKLRGTVDLVRAAVRDKPGEFSFEKLRLSRVLQAKRYDRNGVRRMGLYGIAASLTIGLLLAIVWAIVAPGERWVSISRRVGPASRDYTIPSEAIVDHNGYAVAPTSGSRALPGGDVAVTGLRETDTDEYRFSKGAFRTRRLAGNIAGNGAVAPLPADTQKRESLRILKSNERPQAGLTVSGWERPSVVTGGIDGVRYARTKLATPDDAPAPLTPPEKARGEIRDRKSAWERRSNTDGRTQNGDSAHYALLYTGRDTAKPEEDIHGFDLGSPLSAPLDMGAAGSETKFVPYADGKAETAWQDLGRTETLLRAYLHYASLDADLTLETFNARQIALPPPVVGDEGLGRDGFRARYGTNPFVDTRRDHLSTFGMDVDTASYVLARSALKAGRLPAPETVRVEEFVNSFPGEHQADPTRAFSVFCEGGPSPFGEGLELLQIAVKARELREGERRNAVLTFAIDTSGSMAAIDGDAMRLSVVKDALTTLVSALSADDRVGIVAYSTQPYLVLPHTPARERSRILGAVASLSPAGATNVEAGLDLAYRVADEVFDAKALNRVILCSDGVANVGARGPDEILRRVEVYARRGIFLSAVGVGMDHYDDAMLKTLASKGNGNYVNVPSAREAARVFVEGLPQVLHVLAQDAKIQVDFNPDVVSHYRLLGYEQRDIKDEDFRNDKVDAGEVGPGSTVTVLYEIRRRTNPRGALGTIYLRYRETGTGRIEELDYPLNPGVLATRLDDATDRFLFLACVAETAELLRGSYWASDGSYAKVQEVLARMSPAFRAEPHGQELAAMVSRAQLLTVRRLGELAAARQGML